MEDAFNASLQDLPNELTFNPFYVSPEVVALQRRMGGFHGALPNGPGTRVLRSQRRGGRNAGVMGNGLLAQQNALMSVSSSKSSIVSSSVLSSDSSALSDNFDNINLLEAPSNPGNVMKTLASTSRWKYMCTEKSRNELIEKMEDIQKKENAKAKSQNGAAGRKNAKKLQSLEEWIEEEVNDVGATAWPNVRYPKYATPEQKMMQNDCGWRYTIFCAFEKTEELYEKEKKEADKNVKNGKSRQNSPQKRPNKPTAMKKVPRNQIDSDDSENNSSSSGSKIIMAKCPSDCERVALNQHEFEPKVQEILKHKKLVGVLVLKHSSPGTNLLKRCACVKYIGSTRRGVGHRLQQTAKEFCIMQLHISQLYAGAWLEYEGSWLAHFNWGYDVAKSEEWPRGLWQYGKGILSMVWRFQLAS